MKSRTSSRSGRSSSTRSTLSVPFCGMGLGTETGLRERKPVSVPRPIPQKGTESVLLVEDDRPLRELVRDFMLDLGYQVSTASDGAQALELIENTSGPIHLMITDLVIPRISGDQV